MSLGSRFMDHFQKVNQSGEETVQNKDSEWPEEPHRRKTVLVLNQQDIEALDYEEGGVDVLCNEEIHILSPSSQHSNPVVQGLLNRGIARSGTVLIQSPFDMDKYENSKQAVERFALDKCLYLSELCSHLGAREVRIEHIEIKNTEGSTTFSVTGNVLGIVGGDTRVENQELDSFLSRLTMKDKFKGGAPDVSAARELLNRTGLINDANMRSLLDMRQNASNLLESRKLHFDMTSETRSNLNVLANFNVPFLSLEAGYDRHIREQTEFTLTIRVDF